MCQHGTDLGGFVAHMIRGFTHYFTVHLAFHKINIKHIVKDGTVLKKSFDKVASVEYYSKHDKHYFQYCCYVHTFA
jgi:hypothetical protein